MSSRNRTPSWFVALAPVAGMGAVIFGCIGVCVGFPCFTTGLKYGLWLDHCPTTDLRLDGSAEAQSLLRGQEGGSVWLAPSARWLDGDGRDAARINGPITKGYDWTLSFRDAAGAEVPGLELGKAERVGTSRKVPVRLPVVPDGDYVLAAVIDAGFEAATFEIPLALYAPATVHILTDRPLYKPGQEVLIRSVTLRQSDLTPLDGRPGRWRVTDPQGQEMLVEKDRAEAFGVASTSFPLDVDATVGTWSVSWISGSDSDTSTFEVRPFRLPRFTVEAAPTAPWSKIGDRLILEGTARYTSGAPVAGQPVTVQLQVQAGNWPMPLEWEEARPLETGADGRFRVDFGLVPPDLIGRVTLGAQVSVVERTGERATTVAPIILSQRSLKVDALTELGEGLVEGANNRVYLRVATPDDRPLAGAEVKLTRPYDPKDPGRTAVTDVDGVASVQLDPGPPVTVVDPAPPTRPRPLVPETPSLSSATELTEGRSLDLEERRAMDRLVPQIAACGSWAAGPQNRGVGVRVDRGGGVRQVSTTADDGLTRCVAAAMRQLRMPASAGERVYNIEWYVPDALLPSLGLRYERYGSIDPSGPLNQQALAARRCFPRGAGINGAQVGLLHWSAPPGARSVQFDFTETPGHGLSPSMIGCVRSAFGSVPLTDTNPSREGMGVVHIALSVPQAPGTHAPQPTARTAYELHVVATHGDEALGTGRLVLPVGVIPPLRLRATPSLARPGDQVTIEILRGAQFQGVLPEELVLREGTSEVAKAKVEGKSVTFTLPTDTRGFLHVEWGGARAVVFVSPASPLAVTLATDRSTYRPGETAQLEVRTTAGDGPTPAAVGLVGVDSALAQLAPLLGPDAFGRVTVRATSDKPAFGAFDARALTLGQIRGENAAKAAVLQISGLPADPAGNRAISASVQHEAQTEQVLITNFYRGLERASSAVRRWEKDAPAGELMDPPRMVAVWNDAVGTLAKEGAPVVDGYGRTLTLDVVPQDLLALLDPRAMVSDGTRLPEDDMGWIRYIQEEVE